MPLHEAMGFAFNRDGIVQRGGRPKKETPEEEAARKKREQRPDLLAMEDQVRECVWPRCLCERVRAHLRGPLSSSLT